MNDESNPSAANPHPVLEIWKESRSGAWAGRGFHYQHLVSALVLIHQHVGLVPPGYLVPEGLEDCVFEARDHSVWIQIKSRKDGTFRAAEVQSILADVDRKATRLKDGTDTRVVIVLEQPRHEEVEADMDQLFGDEAPGSARRSGPIPQLPRLNLLLTVIPVPLWDSRRSAKERA